MALGEKLREAREAKAWSLEEASEATKIRIKYLSALEEENFALLPGRVYGKAFLRTYARFLGLDELQLAEEFDQLCPPPDESPQQPPPQLLAQSDASGRKGWKALVVILSAVLLLFAINKAYQHWKGNPPPSPTAEEVQRPPVPEKPPANPSAVISKPQTITLKLKVTNSRCWMRVITDGAVAFEGELQAGQEKSFQAKRDVQLLLGNAGAVAVTLNGKDLGYLGRSGEVVTRQFTLNEGGSG
ncbi:helix-turn-helix domain-containing protein [Desulfothermobacter acidiphilus]|uniref:helix-turn-helix domain-containing protein n=1 Tax=Desulfothermobacter acidiphilus TaxID=1938353 RepID=UPI003F8A7F8D